MRAVAPAFMSFEDTSKGLGSPLRTTAARHDTPSLSREAIAFSLTATRLLLEADGVHERAARLAARLAGELTRRGRTVAPRDATTLVSWEDPEPEAARDRLAEAGVVVRNLPGTPYVRASVGAWNDERDLDRLLSAAVP